MSLLEVTVVLGWCKDSGFPGAMALMRRQGADNRRQDLIFAISGCRKEPTTGSRKPPTKAQYHEGWSDREQSHVLFNILLIYS